MIEILRGETGGREDLGVGSRSLSACTIYCHDVFLYRFLLCFLAVVMGTAPFCHALPTLMK